jgi:Rrf2 family protein
MIYSKPCEYAIRSLCYLANLADHRPARGQEIATAEKIPGPVLSKILQQLARKGLLDSRRGPGGGFRLGRRAELITLRDMVAAVDGLDHFYDCCTGLEYCSDDAPCPLHDSWKVIREQILNDLETTTVAQMAAAVVRKKKIRPRASKARK